MGDIIESTVVVTRSEHAKRILRDDPTITYSQVARDVGLSRERVRQLAVKLGNTGKVRAAVRKTLAFQRSTSCPGFGKLVKGWLGDAGYGYCELSCHIGGRVVDIDIMAKSRPKCKVCASLYVKKWLAKHPYRAAELYKQGNTRKLSKGYFKTWYQANKDRVLVRSSQWVKANPDMVRANNSRRATRITGAGGSYTGKQFSDLKRLYGNICLCCKLSDLKLTADHVIPVSRGGSSDISNIQPLCQSCNSSKGIKIIDYRTKQLDTHSERTN